jgi:hypothetical protein
MARTLISVGRIMDAVKGHNRGFCVACGADAAGVKGDARNHKCKNCGKPAVYGADELLLMAGGFLRTERIKRRYFTTHVSHKTGCVVTVPTQQWEAVHR